MANMCLIVDLSNVFIQLSPYGRCVEEIPHHLHHLRRHPPQATRQTRWRYAKLVIRIRNLGEIIGFYYSLQRLMLENPHALSGFPSHVDKMAVYLCVGRKAGDIMCTKSRIRKGRSNAVRVR